MMQMNRYPYKSATKWPTHDVGLNGLGIIPMSDTQLAREIEGLTRHAALKVFESENAVAGLDQAVTERDFDYRLQKSIEQELVDGLASADLGYVTEQDFNRQLYRMLTDNSLDGFFSKIKKSFKRLGRNVKKVFKRVTKPVVKIHRKVGRAVKKVAKKTFKAVKKVAPYAAAAAALYYGGPAALTALKSAGGGLLSMGQKVAGQFLGPKPAPAQMQQPISSPSVIDQATNIAKQLLARQNIQMQSPQAQQILTRYVGTQTQNIARRAPPQPLAPRREPPTEGMPQWLKIGLPIGAVALTALVLKG